MSRGRRSKTELRSAVRSVGNIQKITKAMKMVAASKMRSAQAATLESRGIAAPMLKLLGDLPNADAEKSVYVTVTTDRGLCGGINSSVVKYLRASIKAIGGARVIGGGGGRAGGGGVRRARDGAARWAVPKMPPPGQGVGDLGWRSRRRRLLHDSAGGGCERRRSGLARG